MIMFAIPRVRSFGTAISSRSSDISFPKSLPELARYTNHAAQHMGSVDFSKLLVFTANRIRKSPPMKVKDVWTQSTFDHVLNTALNKAKDAGDASKPLTAMSELTACMPFEVSPKIRSALLDWIDSNELVISAQNFADIAFALARLIPRNVRVTSWIREHSLRLAPELTGTRCRILLRVLIDLRITDAHLISLLLERMTKEVHQHLDAHHVVGYLYTFAYTKFYHPEIIGRCKRLLQIETVLFDSSQLVESGLSLVRLQNYGRELAETIESNLLQSVELMRANELSDTLILLTHSMEPNLNLLDAVFDVVSNGSIEVQTPRMKLHIASAICYFKLRGNLRSVVDEVIV